MAIYDTDWYDAPHYIKTSFLMILMKARNPFVIEVYALKVNLESYADVRLTNLYYQGLNIYFSDNKRLVFIYHSFEVNGQLRLSMQPAK
jgi:hypothetical protein